VDIIDVIADAQHVVSEDRRFSARRW